MVIRPKRLLCGFSKAFFRNFWPNRFITLPPPLDNKPKIVLVIKPKDAIKAKDLYADILWHIEEKKKIPYLLVAHFLSLLTNEKDYGIYENAEEAAMLARVGLDRFERHKKYQFQWVVETRSFNGVEYKHQNNLPYVLYICIHTFLIYKKEYESNNKNLALGQQLSKEDCIIFFYRLLTEEFFSKTIQSDTNKDINFTEYKRKTIAAYLTEVIGISVCNVKNPTNSHFHQAARNAIAKFEKENS